jgi:hypothetical protein
MAGFRTQSIVEWTVSLKLRMASRESSALSDEFSLSLSLRGSVRNQKKCANKAKHERADFIERERHQRPPGDLGCSTNFEYPGRNQTTVALWSGRKNVARRSASSAAVLPARSDPCRAPIDDF